MKQLIIARKDLQMNPGKLAAQVSHASMAFLTHVARENNKKLLKCNLGYAWSKMPVAQSNVEKQIELTQNRMDRIRELEGPESDYEEKIIQKDDRYYLLKPQWYRRAELHQWSKEARQRGEEYFYYRPVDPDNPYGELELCEPTYYYQATINFDVNTWENWIEGSFTKVVCEAKNKYQLKKIIPFAREQGLEENKDFFLIKDNCLTELTPEEIDENGIGRTLTCIGFRPLEDAVVHLLSKKYQLYR